MMNKSNQNAFVQQSYASHVSEREIKEVSDNYSSKNSNILDRFLPAAKRPSEQIVEADLSNLANSKSLQMLTKIDDSVRLAKNKGQSPTLSPDRLQSTLKSEDSQIKIVNETEMTNFED